MTLYRKIKWAFFTTPKHAADWAAQNEWRITAALGVFFTVFILLLLFGQLPTWAG